MKATLAFLTFVGISLFTGFAGSLVTDDAVNTWYREIQKPFFTPPDWVFPVVWTSLFLMMGTAAWLVWRRTGLRHGRTALALFGVQLILNFAWSALFFGLRSPGAALVEIVVLIAVVAATLIVFNWHEPRAALLMLPYLAWISFASLLNASIWWMN